MSFPLPILIACILNLTDVVSGVVVALKLRDLKSKKLRDGLFKKVGFFLCYLLAWGLDNYGHVIGFNFTVPVLGVVVLYVCTTEIVSITENICQLNPDIMPDTILKYFGITKDGKK